MVPLQTRRTPSRRDRLEEAIRHVNRRYAPWLSLALGVATAVLWREGVDSVRAAVVLVSLAAAISLFVLFPPWRSRGAPWLRGASWFTAVNLAQNALWFVVPLYVLSTTWASANAPFTLWLVLLCVLSCFDVFLRERVLRGGVAAVAFLAPTLLAALQLFLPVLTGVAPRWTIFASGALAALAASALLRADARSPIRPPRLALVPALGIAFAGALVARAALPLLPPAPLRMAGSSFALERDGLEPVLPVSVLETAPSPPAYVFFFVEAPRGVHESVRVVIENSGALRESRPLGIEGGRSGGYRLWAPVSRAIESTVRASVRTLGGQIVGETSIRIVPANVAQGSVPAVSSEAPGAGSR
jgi:hypothetical protein